MNGHLIKDFFNGFMKSDMITAATFLAIVSGGVQNYPPRIRFLVVIIAH